MKKYLLLLLSAALVLTLCACGGQEAPATEAAAIATTEATAEPTTEATTEATTEPTEPPTESEGMIPILVNDTVEIYQRGERDLTVTLKGLELKETYTVNQANARKDSPDYLWQVSLTSGGKVLHISKVHWAYNPGEETEMKMEDISTSLYYNNGGTYDVSILILDEQNTAVKQLDCQIEYAEDSITWNFTLPESYLDIEILNVLPIVDGNYDLTAVEVSDYLLPLEFDFTAITQVETAVDIHGEKSQNQTFDLAQ